MVVAICICIYLVIACVVYIAMRSVLAEKIGQVCAGYGTSLNLPLDTVFYLFIEKHPTVVKLLLSIRVEFAAGSNHSRCAL